MTLSPHGRIAAGLVGGALVAGTLAFAPATAAAAAPGVDVLILNDAAYVDTIPVADVTANEQYGSEAPNMIIALQAKGHRVKAFTGTNPTALATALATADTFVIPEQEQGSWTAALSGPAKAAVVNWVRAGGTLVVACDYTNALNGLFGYSVPASSSGNGWKNVATGKSPFVGGPANLPDNDGSSAFPLNSLPTKAVAQYVDAASETAGVYTVPEGKGTVVSLGWDWFDAAPANPSGQDSGWNSVLDRSVRIAPPSNAFVLPAKGRANTKNGTLTLSVKLPGAGRLQATSAKKGTLKSVSKSVGSKGTATVKLKPSKATLKKLKKKLAGKKKASVRVRAKVTFTPKGGTPRTLTKVYTLTLKKKK